MDDFVRVAFCCLLKVDENVPYLLLTARLQDIIYVAYRNNEAKKSLSYYRWHVKWHVSLSRLLCLVF